MLKSAYTDAEARSWSRVQELTDRNASALPRDFLRAGRITREEFNAWAKVQQFKEM